MEVGHGSDEEAEASGRGGLARALKQAEAQRTKCVSLCFVCSCPIFFSLWVVSVM